METLRDFVEIGVGVIFAAGGISRQTHAFVVPVAGAGSAFVASCRLQGWVR